MIRTIKMKLLVSLLMLAAFTNFVKAADFNILKYGAVGDGMTLNTTAIQKAIDECHQSGGGKVIFPEGNFFLGLLY